MRILRIELRRSAAGWAGLMLLIVGTWLLFSARERWTTGYMILAMDQRWYLPLLTGLAVAAGAWQGRREHACGVTELFASVPRPRAQQVVPILLVYGATLAIAYAGAWGLAALRIAGTAEYLRAAAVAGVVAAGVVALVAAAWFGLAVGRMLPYVVTAPLLAIATFATPLVARAITGHREWLSTLLFPGYPLGGPTDFATVPGRFSLAQLLYLTGLAAGAALLFAAARRVALLPVLLGTTAAVLILQGGAAFVGDAVDPAARELVCTSDAPYVCVARVHSGVLDEVTPPARAALAKLARLPGAPSRAEEHLDTPLEAGRYPDSLLMRLAIGDDGHVAGLGRLEDIMLNNVGIIPFACPDEAPGPDLEVTDAATSWLRGAEPAPLRNLDEREAAARVAAVRRAVLTCAPADDLLTRSSSLPRD